MTRQELLNLVSTCEDLIDWAWTQPNGEPGWRGYDNMKGSLEYFGKIREAIYPFRRQGFSRRKE